MKLLQSFQDYKIKETLRALALFAFLGIAYCIVQIGYNIAKSGTWMRERVNSVITKTRGLIS